MFNLKFDYEILNTIVGGASVLELPSLRVTTREEARSFILGYGYDLEADADSARLWSFHRRAVSYIETQLLNPGEKVPDEFGEAILLKDLANLLIAASDQSEGRSLRQRWACAILRVMHVMNHLSNDLFTAFSDDIQEQIMKPYQEVIQTDASGRVQLGRSFDEEQIPLDSFDVKPFKTSNSAITKLLAKPEEVAFGLLDKMGVRFVTHSVFDCFRVLRWLWRQNVINIAHLIPDESNNTLFPLNLFLESMNELSEGASLSPLEIEKFLEAKLKKESERAQFRTKLNVFTSPDYRFMKFIVRRLIRTRNESLDRPLMFFYPYEVQIVDRATYQRNSNGPSSHVEYKSRQRLRARDRVFGKKPLTE